MPTGRPPKTLAVPHFRRLEPGTLLWRLGRAPAPGTTRRSTPIFNSPRRLDAAMYPAKLGGRFDPEPAAGFSYAALDEVSVISEVLLRDLAWDGPRRYLPLQMIQGRSLMMIETLRPIWLISLTRLEDLAAIQQDTWLIQAEPREFALTQAWGRWLQSVGVSAENSAAGERPAGIVWPAKRNPGGEAVLLRQDVCGRATLRTAFERPIDRGPGLDWLERRLRTLQTRVRRPKTA